MHIILNPASPHYLYIVQVSSRSHPCMLVTTPVRLRVQARVLNSLYREYKWLLSARHVFPSSSQRNLPPNHCHYNHFHGEATLGPLQLWWPILCPASLDLGDGRWSDTSAYAEARVVGRPLFPSRCPPGIRETLFYLRPPSCKWEERCGQRKERCQGNRGESKWYPVVSGSGVNLGVTGTCTR